jgi:hypothetical protein
LPSRMGRAKAIVELGMGEVSVRGVSPFWLMM